MSRVSLARRLSAILEDAERIDPQAARVFRMKPAIRQRYDIWRAECERVIGDLGGPAMAFEQYLQTGEWSTHTPPRNVAIALGMVAGPVLTDDMSAQDVAVIYAEMIEG